MITVDSIICQYNDFVAVDNVSFSINKGEVVGLLGHNGAGKTSIMKALTGFLHPVSGKIFVKNIDLDKAPLQVQQHIGYLPESPPSYPELSVIEYLEYAARLKQIEPCKISNAIKQVIEQTELQEKQFEKIDTLSRGYRQRVGVAQALLGNPSILILDEPTNGLDPQQIEHMRALLKNLAKNATVIISTHILQEVQAICDRVLILNSGKLTVDAYLSDLQVDNKITVESDCKLEDINTWFATNSWFQQAEQIAIGSYNGKFNICLTESVLKDNKTIAGISATISKQIIDNHHNLHAIYLAKKDLENVFKEQQHGASNNAA